MSKNQPFLKVHWHLDCSSHSLEEKMTSINPAREQQLYSDYKSSIDDLRSEQEKEIEGLKARQDRELKERLSAKDAENEKLLNEARSKLSNQVLLEKSRSTAENDKLKSQLYDRSGRMQQEVEGVKNMLSASQEQFEAEREFEKNRVARNDADQAAKQEMRARENTAKTEEAVARTRDAINKAQAEARLNRRDDVEETKSHLKAQFEEKEKQLVQDRTRDQKSFQKELKLLRENYERQVANLENQQEERIIDYQRMRAADVETAVDQTNKSHLDTTLKLRTDVKNLQDRGKDFTRGYSEGKQEAIREHDDNWRSATEDVSRQFQVQLNDTKKRAAENESLYAAKNEQAVNERDNYYTKVIHEQNINHRGELGKVLSDNARAQAQMKLENEREKKRSEVAMEQQADRLNVARDQDIQVLSEASRKTLDQNRKMANDTISNLKKEVSYRSTSDDPNLISPAAENRIRATFLSEYEKTMALDQKRNRQASDDVREKYTGLLSDSQQKTQDTLTTQAQAYESKYSDETGRLMEHVLETEAQKKEAIRNMDQASNREKDSIQKNYARLMENQRRAYEQMYNAQKLQSDGELAQVRQEGEFKLRTATKEFAKKLSESGRDAAQKLADQEQDYKAQIENLKSDYEAKFREQETKNKLAMEAQTRLSEQQLVQQKQIGEERARAIEYSYQKEMEAVRRASENNVRKKA